MTFYSPEPIRRLASTARLDARTEAVLVERPFCGMRTAGLDDAETGMVILAAHECFPHASIDDRFSEYLEISIAELIHVCEARLNWCDT